MNFLKRSIIVLVIFMLLVIIISLFLPADFRMERSIVIDADKEQVFKQVNDLKNWKNWSPWAKKDSAVYALASNYTNPSSGMNASFKWDSENDEVGSGKMTIVASEVNHKVAYKIDLSTGEVMSAITLDDVEGGVLVNWSMEVDFGFNPIAKFFGLFMEDVVANDYDEGLDNLKKYAEELPKIKRVEVTEKRIEGMWFLSLRDSIDPKQMNNIHGKMYASINAFMESNELEVSGSPIVIYHYWSDTLVDIEAGLPIGDSIEVIDPSIKLNMIPAGKVVSAIHYGAYERLPETYFGINEWMRKNKVIVTGPPWEVYITDPATESNPEKWETAIYFPIE